MLSSFLFQVTSGVLYTKVASALTGVVRCSRVIATKRGVCISTAMAIATWITTTVTAGNRFVPSATIEAKSRHRFKYESAKITTSQGFPGDVVIYIIAIIMLKSS